MAPRSRSPSPIHKRKTSIVSRLERCCWTTLICFPLVFVYGLTTWAIYVHNSLSLTWAASSWQGYLSLAVGTTFYLLLNWSYSTAVFTDPGSPLTSSRAPSSSITHLYSHVSTQDSDVHPDLPSFTVKSTGESRYCKKCQAKKPDRAHHCSTCRRCVLKMDHHCPWLATCVGFRNYKAFLLFILYTTLFCWHCCFVSSTFLWSEIENDMRLDQGFMAVNMVLLSVLSGIIGLVLTGFTGWHLSLAYCGQTTIECLEKTRYLSPLRKSMKGLRHGPRDGDNRLQRYGQQLAEIHANSIPGVTRVEEGEEPASPEEDLEAGITAQEAFRMTYDEVERVRERERYEEYLDEQDSEKLPNAFDLGWRKNLTHLFGDSPLLWMLPVCNTQGDGWRWEPSPKWVAAREQIRLTRERHWADLQPRPQVAAGSEYRSYQTVGEIDGQNRYMTTTDGVTIVPNGKIKHGSKANQILGRTSSQYVDEELSDDGRPGSQMSLRTIRRKSSFESDGDDEGQLDGNLGYGQTSSQSRPSADQQTGVDAGWRNWD